MRRVVVLLLAVTLTGCQVADKVDQASAAAERAVKSVAERGRNQVENLLRKATPW